MAVGSEARLREGHGIAVDRGTRCLCQWIGGIGAVGVRVPVSHVEEFRTGEWPRTVSVHARDAKGDWRGHRRDSRDSAANLALPRIPRRHPRLPFEFHLSQRPRFSVFGIGEYSFAQWKVAISGFYKSLDFRVVAPCEGRPVVLDDTCYFLPFRSEKEAVTVAELLNSDKARGFFKSVVFWDANDRLRLVCSRVSTSDGWPIRLEKRCRNPIAVRSRRPPPHEETN